MKIIKLITENPVIILLFFIKDSFDYINWINDTTMQPIDFIDLGIKIFLATLVIWYADQVKRQNIKLKIFNEISKIRLRNIYLSGIQATVTEKKQMLNGYLYDEQIEARQQILGTFPKKTTKELDEMIDEFYS